MPQTRIGRTRIGLGAALLLASSGAAFALTDEIQVYTGDVAAPGVFNLTVHSNYNPGGLKTPDFPGGLVDDNGFSGVAEWAYA